MKGANGVAMGRLEFGSLRDAWKGEASDFTPLLAEQLDAVGDAIGVNLLAIGQAEVRTTGGRSIDIVAQSAEGPEFVIENQYGRADHDHLTRGLAYAVAREARGLIVVAENHRDEFRAVAQYLNDMAEHDPEHGIAVWLVEAKAARIGDSAWAPLFVTVASPNAFTAQVEEAKQAERTPSIDEFFDLCETAPIRAALETIVNRWRAMGHRLWRWPNYIALAAIGPAKSGERSVLALYPNGQVAVPFGAYGGQNTGIPIEILSTDIFRERAKTVFGLAGTRSIERTELHWINPVRSEAILSFASEVADAYNEALATAGATDADLLSD